MVWHNFEKQNFSFLNLEFSQWFVKNILYTYINTYTFHSDDDTLLALFVLEAMQKNARRSKLIFF